MWYFMSILLTASDILNHNNAYEHNVESVELEAML